MGATTSGMMFAQFAGGLSQSMAASSQATFEQQRASANARLMELNAREALKRGDRTAAEHGRRIKTLIGQQRAGLAAQGIEVDSGTALDIQEQTREIGLQEMETIRNNAWREAFGMKQAAGQERTSGRYAGIAGRAAARSSLITGGINALDVYARSDSYAKSVREDLAAERSNTWNIAKYDGGK